MNDLARAIPMMMPELMDKWFESELLRGTLGSIGIKHLNQGPYSSATMLNFLHHNMYSKGIIKNSYIIQNGTENIANTLLLIAKSQGVAIKNNTEVSSIICNNDYCTGVTTANGAVYYSKYIISGIDLNSTYFKLLKHTSIPPSAIRKTKNIILNFFILLK